MMAAEGDNIVTYIFTGKEVDENGDYIIPQNATHLIIHESVTSIPAYAIYEHPNLVEVYCHAGVKRIERGAFYSCPRLRRVIIPGVEVVEECAFYECEAVIFVECPKLESIEENAFVGCKSLGSIDLPSAKEVGGSAFEGGAALMEAKFGKHLDSIDERAFFGCHNLKRITIPLRYGLWTDGGDMIFTKCANLEQVDLVEGAILQETAAALHLEVWRNDMTAEISSINQILPDAPAGHVDLDEANFQMDEGQKAFVIEDWIDRVLSKIVAYKSLHHGVLTEAAAALQLALPSDIVTNSVLPFLKLPSHTFGGEEDEQEVEDESDSDDESHASDGRSDRRTACVIS